MLYGRSFDGNRELGRGGQGGGPSGARGIALLPRRQPSYTDSAWTWEEWVIPSVSSKDTRQRAAAMPPIISRISLFVRLIGCRYFEANTAPQILLPLCFQ